MLLIAIALAMASRSPNFWRKLAGWVSVMLCTVGALQRAKTLNSEVLGFNRYTVEAITPLLLCAVFVATLIETRRHDRPFATRP